MNVPPLTPSASLRLGVRPSRAHTLNVVNAVYLEGYHAHTLGEQIATIINSGGIVDIVAKAIALAHSLSTDRDAAWRKLGDMRQTQARTEARAALAAINTIIEERTRATS